MDKAIILRVMKINGVRSYQVAERLGIAESTLSSKLRQNLTPEFEKAVFDAIKDLIKKRGD